MHTASSDTMSLVTWCGGLEVRYVKSSCSSPLASRNLVFPRSRHPASDSGSAGSGRAVMSTTHGIIG